MSHARPASAVLTPTDQLLELLNRAKLLARQYRDLTGRPLGITAEAARVEAARLLHLELSPARNAGYDAIRRVAGGVERLQIKGRVLHSEAGAERMGTMKKAKEWDAVLLVILDENYDASLIFEASRAVLIAEMTREGADAKARARGALIVQSFCQIARQIWPPLPA